MVTFQFWWHFSFEDILVLNIFSFDDILVLVIFQLCRFFSFCTFFWDFSVFGTFQFSWHFCFGDILVLADVSALVTFHFCEILFWGTFWFWWHSSFGDISVLITFQFHWHFSFNHISAVYYVLSMNYCLLNNVHCLLNSKVLVFFIVCPSLEQWLVFLTSLNKAYNQMCKQQHPKYSASSDFDNQWFYLRKSGVWQGKPYHRRPQLWVKRHYQSSHTHFGCHKGLTRDIYSQ